MKPLGYVPAVKHEADGGGWVAALGVADDRGGLAFVEGH